MKGTAAMPVVLEVALFQAAWWLAVLGTVAGWICAAPIVVAIYLLFQLTRVDPERHVRIVTAALVLGAAGFLIDSLLSAGGVLTFASRSAGAPAPLWVAALWAQLAGAAAPFARLADRPLLAAALGALAGPLAYRTGAALGAVEIHAGGLGALAALALVWALATPAIAVLSRWVVAAPADGGETVPDLEERAL